MARASARAGYGRLLDAWTAPEGAGEPIGCIATSFTFDNVFFEEECLGRFLRLESDPTEDGPIYLLEREEKLAQIACAAALVDAHHCQGRRSLRWDLLPVSVPRALLHAKVAILVWRECVRVLVASANLTEDGYRRNQEVFGVLDYRAGGMAPGGCLEGVVGLVESLVESGWARGAESSLQRVRTLLGTARERAAEWGTHGSAEVRVEPILVGPGRPSAVEQLARVWPGQSPASLVRVVSPFFDARDNYVDVPSQAVWTSLLRKRGAAELRFYVAVEETPDGSAMLVHAPATLARSAPAGRSAVGVRFKRLLLEGRPLHAKALWLESERSFLYMAGSSNFTSAGLGLTDLTHGAGPVNVEANLAYVVDAERFPRTVRALRGAFPEGERLVIDDRVRWQPPKIEGTDAPDGEGIPLPMGFGAATYRLGAEGGAILLELKSPPAGWVLRREEDSQPWLGHADWTSAGAPTRFEHPWKDPRPPTGFWVSWEGGSGQAWWPVTVDSQSSLPPPEELRNLPLDVLVDILTSARPLHRVEGLRRYLARRASGLAGDEAGTAEVAPELDPHRRVDTTRFLLQRTRRVGWALTRLRERLEQPVMTREALDWRLRGPVGVVALADALIRERRSEEEAAFLIAELALELHRAVPRSAVGGLAAEEVRSALRQVARELLARAEPAALAPEGELRQYLARVDELIHA
jgi:hypothetical protein